jgi:pectate lyase
MIKNKYLKTKSLTHFGLFFLQIVLILFCVDSAIALSVFPNATGFGSDTIAGRGGQIIKVTNLNKWGPGSLKEAMDAKGPRIVVFEVGGTIQIDSSIGIRNPFITIAGQTAPSPGITLRGATFVVSTHDVLIQHIRIRTGDQGGVSPTNRDSLQIEPPYLGGDVYNVVIDHCSFSWSIDEMISIWNNGKGAVHDITISNCIISEGLNNSIHPEGAHAMGMIIGPRTSNISIIRNLFAYFKDRVPYIRSESVLIANNFVFRSYNPIMLRDIENPIKASIVGNVVKGNYFLQIAKAEHPDEMQLYVADNQCNKLIESQLNGIYDENNILRNIIIESPTVWPDNFTPMPSGQVESYIFKNAGARPLDRDAVDLRVVEQVSNQQGSIINSQNDVGGWPILGMTYQALSITDIPSGDDDSDGYTNVEDYLQNLNTNYIGSQLSPEPPKGLGIAVVK